MATLAACIIVGKNESFELKRLLESLQGGLFDQICVTTTQNDPEVESVASSLASHVSHFEWVNDFSAARNFCFSQAATSHIMWLDADDVLTQDNYHKILALKPALDNADMIIMSYNYGHDAAGKASVVLPRERIVRNDQTLIKWHDPIHEYLNMDGSLRIASHKEIAVDHFRMKPFNADRNLAIHKKVWDAGTMSPRQMFYYAKDLIDSGRSRESVPVFERYLAGDTDFADNKAVACLRLAGYYRDEVHDNESSMQYLLKGMQYSSQYAEFPFLLGMYYKDVKGDPDTAISYLKEAAGRPMQAGMSMQSEYYEYLPCKHLSFLLFDKGDFSLALHYCERALAACPTDPHCPGNIEVIKRALAGAKEPSKPADLSGVSLAWLLPAFAPEDPSQRIRRLNIHAELAYSHPNQSSLLVGYHQVPAEDLIGRLANTNTVVVSSVSPADLSLVKALRKSGKKVLLDLNEAILDSQAVRDVVAEADVTVCCSSKLAEMASPYARSVVVIPDATEEALKPGEHHNYIRADREKPIALYVGMGGNSFLVTDHLRATIEEAGYDLRVCTEWDNADVKWTLDGWREVMEDADVILCPQRVDVQPAKSNVKATQAMALGLPVVASKLQAYSEVISDDVNGYLCTGLAEWGDALKKLLNPYKRIQVGMNAADSVGQYTKKAVAASWMQLASNVLAGGQPRQAGAATPVKLDLPGGAPREQVPIIIPVYNGLPYLKLCLSSIQMNTTYPYHIILSDAGSDEETWAYLDTLKGITVLGKRGLRRNFSEACNAGILASSGKYYVILNSDVLVSKGWLEPLVEQMSTGDRLAACGVLSNCDRGWLNGVPGRNEVFPMRLVGAGLELVPAMKIEQIIPNLDELDQFMAWSNKNNSGKYVSQPWVAAYATIFARSATDDVGLFDPSFKNGCEDLDLCRRLTSMSYNIGQRMDSFIFHFGGISRGCYEQENAESYGIEDRYNHDLYRKKWEKDRVVIYTGPAWEKWDRAAVASGMAGSETWAAELSAELSRRGYYVTLFNDCPEDGAVDADGVVYRHHSKYQEYLAYNFISHTILSRTCEPLKAFPLHSGTVDVMVHDIWLSQDPNYDTMQWAVGKFGVLSEWHRDFFSEHHRIPKEKLFLTSNGVDHSMYSVLPSVQKRNMAVYSSSPDRGLKQLLEMVPSIREEVPDFELVVAYGFHNWESAARMRGNEAEMAIIAEMKSMLDQPGVRYVGRVPKKELASLQLEAKVWAYPSGFTETFCIGAVENGLAGNAVVTTPIAGILTTMGTAPAYISGPEDVHPTLWNATKQYQKDFVAETVLLLRDEKYRSSKAAAARTQASRFTWGYAADGWERLWRSRC